MGIKTIVSFAFIGFAISVGGALADDQTTANESTFSAMQGLHATPLTAQDMDKIRGAFNLWVNRNGDVFLAAVGHGNFQNTPGFNNVIVGCGGPPQPGSTC